MASTNKTCNFSEHCNQEINMNCSHQVTFFAEHDILGLFENWSYVGNLGFRDSIYFEKCTQKIEQYTQV